MGQRDLKKKKKSWREKKGEKNRHFRYRIKFKTEIIKSLIYFFSHNFKRKPTEIGVAKITNHIPNKISHNNLLKVMCTIIKHHNLKHMSDFKPYKVILVPQTSKKSHRKFCTDDFFQDGSNEKWPKVKNCKKLVFDLRQPYLKVRIQVLHEFSFIPLTTSSRSSLDTTRSF